MIEILYVKWSKVFLEDAPAFEFSLGPSGEGVVEIPGEEAIHILELHTVLFDQCPFIMGEIFVFVLREIIIHHIILLFHRNLLENPVQNLLSVLVIAVSRHLIVQSDEKVL